MKILPIQTVLKTVQMNASTPVREMLNPWAAFAVVGILQGGVYGQQNIYFVQKLNIGKQVSYLGLFRGFIFAACRDMASQGIPYVFAKAVETSIVNKIYTSDDSGAKAVKKWVSLFGTSVFATYVSQGFHNCQITMHADQSLNHWQALKKAWALNGLSLLYKGAEARVGLLLVVNFLNELVLKKAWE